jgi:SAM-dependent methyltransferase
MLVTEQRAVSRRVKTAGDGRVMFNIGCGVRMHRDWNNVDFSYLVRLRRHMGLAKWLHRFGVLSELRWNRVPLIAPDVIVHDLRKGIPAPDDSVDVVYHSHVLEHIDRDIAPIFLRECLRVLRPGGILRVAVPDLEKYARDYLSPVAILDAGG